MTGKPVTGKSVSRPDRRIFTGWHMLAILTAFFGVVLVVNVVMARLALSTFSGEVVENSYVASQLFNGWLDRAKAERALGWNTAIVQAGGVLTVTLTDDKGRAIGGARLTGVAMHPLGDANDHALLLTQTRPGVYTAALPAGRWKVHLLVEAHGQTMHTVADLNAGPGQ